MWNEFCRVLGQICKEEMELLEECCVLDGSEMEPGYDACRELKYDTQQITSGIVWSVVMMRCIDHKGIE
jgi:hypothetical protein